LEALGIYIDGNELKIANVLKTKNSIEILNLEKVYLRSYAATDKEKTGEGYENVFGLKEEEKPEVKEDVEPESEDTIVFNTISKYLRKKIRIGVNILESNVSFTTIKIEDDKKKKNVHKIILEKLREVSKDIDNENFSYIPITENEYVAFYHNNQLNLLDEVLNVKDTVKINARISLVDINEIALINLFKNMVDVDNEISILVYVGNEFSRILFFEGKKLIAFSQIINEGYHSDNLLVGLQGKIVFEQDTAEFEKIDNIFITGSGKLNEYQQFFKNRYPDSKVDTLPYNEYFNISDEENKDDIDEYAIPLAIAWKILDSKDKDFIDTNFLPIKIKKQQKILTISWHGFVLIVLILLSAVFLFRENQKYNSRIEKIKSEIESYNTKINELSPVAAVVDSLMNEITWNNFRMSLVDSLKPDNMLFSNLLNYLSENVEKINSIWLENISLTKSNFVMSGKALYKTRIHRLADIFEDSRINNVTSEEVMGKTIYSFNITGSIPQKNER